MSCVDPEREQKAVCYLKSAQLPGGGWPIYYGGPAEIQRLGEGLFCVETVRRVGG